MTTSVGLALAIPFAAIAGCIDVDSGSMDDLSNAAQASTVATAEEEPPPTLTDTTSYTYSVPAGAVGTFADLPVTRTFDRPIASLQLFIEAGRADDIGFVGSRLVTSVPAACSDVGTVTGEQDVSDQVAKNGNTASFVLRAQENCCCATGWGSATQSDRADALFRWVVTFRVGSAADLIARSVDWNTEGDGVDFTYEVTDQDLEQDTTVGLFWAKGPNQDDIISQAFSQVADKTVGVHMAHATAGEIATAPNDATYLLNVVDRDNTIEDNPSNNQVALRLPHIEVIDPPNTTDFRITTEPAMPSITVGLNDVPANRVQALSVHWHTEITSGPDPAIHQIATFTATPIDFTVTSSDRYQPNFGTQIVGGKLTFTADFSVAGVQLKASSEDLHLRILGTQPDAVTIEAYIRAKHVPHDFPTGGGFTYHDVLLRIMKKESLRLQFHEDGSPVFNANGNHGLGDGGAGLFQITPPKKKPPTIAQVWNWKANVDEGGNIFNDKLTEAIGFIDARAVREAAQRVRQQFHLPGNTLVQVVRPPWPRDVMVLREAVQRYNGGRAFDARGQRVILTNGTTIIEVTWERTENHYHVDVLGALTP